MSKLIDGLDLVSLRNSSVRVRVHSVGLRKGSPDCERGCILFLVGERTGSRFAVKLQVAWQFESWAGSTDLHQNSERLSDGLACGVLVALNPQVLKLSNILCVRNDKIDKEIRVAF